MMIRINLLPVRAVKKREMGRQILGLLAFALLITLGGNYFWYSSRDAEFTRNANALNALRKSIAEREKIIGEVSTINTRKAEVEKKLAVLDGLRKGRSGPVRMMDALANAVPKKAWLRSFVEEQKSVKLVGSAASHDEVAEFMRGLTSMVWTPKGLGRLVEQRRDAKTSRVELLATPEASVEEFPVGEIKAFFGNIDLKSARAASGEGGRSTIEFEIQLTANYAI
jgi:type IV pilus assembly protein PilN